MTTDARGQLLLLNWMSPTFPIGAFAYSGGLEAAIATGQIQTSADLHQWITDMIMRGSGWTDAVLFSRCWHDDKNELNALALALAGSQERYQETTQLGRNFQIAASVWVKTIEGDEDVAYPVAAGTICANANIEPALALTAYLQSQSATWVSVAVRLVPLGQTKGLEVLRNLSDTISSTAIKASHATLDEIGNTCILAEIAAMKHETLEPRIFRT